jgi:hypothetical protein
MIQSQQSRFHPSSFILSLRVWRLCRDRKIASPEEGSDQRKRLEKTGSLIWSGMVWALLRTRAKGGRPGIAETENRQR